MLTSRFSPKMALALMTVVGQLDAQVSGTLTANAPIFVRALDAQTGQVVHEVSQPAGPLGNVSLNHAGSYYTAALQLLGDELELMVSNQAFQPQAGQTSRVFGDITVVLAASSATIAAITLELQHDGDAAAPNGFAVDFGADGTTEVTSGWPVAASPRHHRSVTWNFAQGSLPIRIQTDHPLQGGIQGYSLSLRATPWAAGAFATAPACPGVASQFGPFNLTVETSDTHLAWLPPVQAGELGRLVASGLGDFDAFVVAMLPTAAPLALPAPFSSGCDVLQNIALMVGGTITATTGSAVGQIPRAWQLRVPVLPPGLTLYVQHLSAQLTPPFQVGASNRLQLGT